MALRSLLLVLDARVSGGVPGPRGFVAGRRSFCLDEILLRFLLDASLAIYSFRLNPLSLVRWPLFIQVTGGQPALLLAGWQSL